MISLPCFQTTCYIGNFGIFVKNLSKNLGCWTENYTDPMMYNSQLINWDYNYFPAYLLIRLSSSNELKFASSKQDISS